MTYHLFKVTLLAILFMQPVLVSAQEPTLKILMIGAHPDDCDLGAGGLALLYAQMGHKVKFVSLTNGDKGHQEMGGGELARRRLRETQEVAKRMGIVYDVIDNHDGELMPTLENRLEVIRKIREWNADIVIAPRTNDYHPDHRNTGVLVQDAAYLVIVPNILSSVPPLKKNPLFLYFKDRFQKPTPFRPDIAIDISSVIQAKASGLDAHTSQFYEWLPWTSQTLDQVPTDPEKRKLWLLEATKRRASVDIEGRKCLQKWYGTQKGNEVQFAEVFEICEYGLQPSDADIRNLFPMLQP
ncbi:PIG-L deacetylase family protein [Dyadobacter tibetensis]|uniref:PIG-L deacetylase family protein n=1 Tax=Dyadobacter tibetensis TaxID=1211851 RepID=UPI0004AD1562|nr:PIG-L family deacetylase [Dyadobacter tibetensis]